MPDFMNAAQAMVKGIRVDFERSCGGVELSIGLKIGCQRRHQKCSMFGVVVLQRPQLPRDELVQIRASGPSEQHFLVAKLVEQSDGALAFELAPNSKRLFGLVDAVSGVNEVYENWANADRNAGTLRRTKPGT